MEITHHWTWKTLKSRRPFGAHRPLKDTINHNQAWNLEYPVVFEVIKLLSLHSTELRAVSLVMLEVPWLERHIHNLALNCDYGRGAIFIVVVALWGWGLTLLLCIFFPSQISSLPWAAVSLSCEKDWYLYCASLFPCWVFSRVARQLATGGRLWGGGTVLQEKHFFKKNTASSTHWKLVQEGTRAALQIAGNSMILCFLELPLSLVVSTSSHLLYPGLGSPLCP